jgi:repressor LexA
MRDAGILEDDYVIVRPAKDADNGEIVVALLEDEATVKRFYRRRDKISLKPENPAYEPIETTDAELLGKVIGVFRRV